MFEQAFKNIDDALWKESGCTTELDYTEQTSWLLFLKYLDGLEQDNYVTSGVDELDEAKLGPLLKLKYNNSIADAFTDLGSPDQVRNAFVVFQRHLYEQPFHKLSQ